MNFLNIPIARAVTRPSGKIKDLEKFNPASPDLMMVTLLKGSEKYLKSNCVYELAYNDLTGVIELAEVGEANIGKSWGHSFYDIEHNIGKARTWFSKEEYKELEG